MTLVLNLGVAPPEERVFSGIIYHHFFVAFLRALKWAALGGGEMGRETESRGGAVKERAGKKISKRNHLSQVALGGA